MTEEVKRKAMDAVSNVETVAQIGWMKTAAAAALYLAHIRQTDRENRAKHPSRSPVINRGSKQYWRDRG